MSGLQILLSCAATWALAAILFRSLPGLWLVAWASGRLKPLNASIYQAEWELRFGRRFDPKFAMARDKRALPEPPALNAEQLADVQAALKDLRLQAWPFRILTYFLGCPLCQHFWCALVLVGPRPVELLACAGLTTLGWGVLAKVSATSESQRPSGCPGGNCG